MLKIYHNPRCSKSRQTLALLTERGLEPQIVPYLDEPLSVDQIKALLTKLGFDDPRALMRRGEADYKALGLKNVDDPKVLIAAMQKHPKLIERPIVETQTQARLGRPPEHVLDIL